MREDLRLKCLDGIRLDPWEEHHSGECRIRDPQPRDALYLRLSRVFLASYIVRTSLGDVGDKPPRLRCRWSPLGRPRAALPSESTATS